MMMMMMMMMNKSNLTQFYKNIFLFNIAFYNLLRFL
jgi:hypothetical protein